MYHVTEGVAWNIEDSRTAEVVLEVTSKDYALFLSRKLNTGTPLEEIRNRKAPDTEFFRYLRMLYPPELEQLGPYFGDKHRYRGEARTADEMHMMLEVALAGLKDKEE